MGSRHTQYVKVILPTRDAFEEFAPTDTFLGSIPGLSVKAVIEGVVVQHIRNQAPDAIRLFRLPYQAILQLIPEMATTAEEFEWLSHKEQEDMLFVIERIALRTYLHFTQLLDALNFTQTQQEMMSFAGWYGYDIAVEVPNL